MFKDLTDLVFVDQGKIAGFGGFSQVHKVMNKNDQKYYALKEIEIKGLGRVQTQALKDELRIHQNLNSPLVNEFIGAIQ